MSSDEDFSLVVDPVQPLGGNLEGIKASITDCKKKYHQLIQEQQELAAGIEDRRDMTHKFRQRTVKLTQDLQEDRRSYREQIDHEKVKLDVMQQEERELMEEIQKVEEALKEEEVKNKHLKQQTDVFTAVPERTVVFTGSTGNGADPFEMKPRIVYPMDGGTVLVTFEDAAVATKIVDMKKHQVDLGADVCITVEARSVHLVLPKLVEIDSEVSPQHILISNLPKMEKEMLLQLEIHFSKRKHGGGEVDRCEMLPDSETAVITFVDKHVAKGLTDKENHEVELQQKIYRVRVTPFLNGNITKLQTKMATCPRTVLLTGIPAIMERETLQDLLEIHFQKSSNGGGEIEAFLYNPAGQNTSALFESFSTNTKDE